MGKRRKKRHIALLATVGVLALGAGTLFYYRDSIIGGIKTKAAAEIGRKLLEEQIGGSLNIAGQKLDVSEIIDQMEQLTQEDKEELQALYEKYKGQIPIP